MNDIRSGDVVVRVRVRDPKRGKNRAKGPLRAPPFGMPVRVANVVGPVGGEMGLVIPGWPSNHPTRAWSHLPFRKIEAPKSELSERIRACRPIREREPA